MVHVLTCGTLVAPAMSRSQEMSVDHTGHEGPLAEFVALRQEIERRANIQQSVFALQLTISGAVFGFALADRSRILLLLILPIATYMLCGRFVSQHYGIEHAGRYIKEELSPRVPGGLHWEAWIIMHRRPQMGLLEWIDPLYVTFPGVAGLSLAWVAPQALFPAGVTSAIRAGLMAIWILGLVAAGASLYMIFSARRRWWRLHNRWLPTRRRARVSQVSPDGGPVTPSPGSAARAPRA